MNRAAGLVVWAGLLAVGVAGGGAAWGQSVAIVAAASANSADPRFTDPQAKILGTGLIATVDIINATTTTPTLEQLQAYDAVITWSNVDYQDEVALGNVLADYVDAGGGVVVAVFANTSVDPDRSLNGRWRTGGYEIVPAALGATTAGTVTLGTVLEPTHPTMQGVSTVFGGNLLSRPTTTTLASHGFAVALWSDGKTLVAASTQFPNRIDLGMYPPSSDVATGWWSPASDGARLMANALLASMGGPPVVCNDIDFNNDGSLFDPTDVDAFLSVFSEGPCIPEGATCDGVDFNNDGSLFDPCDIDSFFLVFSEGPCTACGV
jgi:F0F1-type ATP synthase membrane subunit c/vacuolar-type H+-ATPase subunit K